MQLGIFFLEQHVTIPSQCGDMVEMITIRGLLKDAGALKEIAKFDVVPEIVEVVSVKGVPARLYRVDTAAKMRTKEELDMQRFCSPGLQ